MKPYTCDICEKEAKAHIEISFEEGFWDINSEENYDLCKACYNSLVDKWKTMKVDKWKTMKAKKEASN